MHRPRPLVRLPVADRSAFTLLEVIAVLALGAVLLGLSAPLSRAVTDRWAVNAARDEALAALHRARTTARIRGGALLELDGGTGVVRVLVRDSVAWEGRSATENRVRITLPDGTPGTAIPFDALGLGVVGSRTVLFRRGGAEARLIVSSRGRGRRG